MLKSKVQKMKQKGFTFIEIMIVLAIIGVAVGVAVATGGSAKDNSSVTEASQEIAIMAAAGKTMFASSRGNYTGIEVTGANAVLPKSTRIPETMKNGTDIVNVFGNIVSFTLGTPASTFIVSYDVGLNSVNLCSDIAGQQMKKYFKVTTGASTTDITTIALAQSQCATSQVIKIEVK